MKDATTFVETDLSARSDEDIWRALVECGFSVGETDESVTPPTSGKAGQDVVEMISEMQTRAWKCLEHVWNSDSWFRKAV